MKEVCLDVNKNYSCDVLVVGGGPAGVCAAITAARNGMDVILVEQGGCCGGMATLGLVGPFMTCYDAKGENMIIRGIFEEIVDKLVERGYAIHPREVMGGTAFTSWIKTGHDHVTPFEAEGLKLVLDEMIQESGVKVFYHTSFIKADIEEQKCLGAYVSSKSGVDYIAAKVTIDATGDGDVAHSCKVPFEYGNESLGISQPATMFYHICNVDSKALEKDIEDNLDNFYRKDGVNYRSLHWRVSEARENGDWSLDRVSIGIYRMPKEDEWFINTSRIVGVDSTDNVSLSNAEITGRKQVDEITRFLRKYVQGCENAKIKATASHIGIRESRHIAGRYKVTKEDLLSCKVPYDSVFVAANSVDVHGRFGPKSNEYVTIDGDYYGVPYRSLVPVDVEGLLIAGRCISADSTAAGAVRVMPPCMAMGQAVGTAAAISIKEGILPSEIHEKCLDVLQNKLVEDGVYLPLEKKRG